MTFNEWKRREYSIYEGDIYFFTRNLDVCLKCPIAYQNDILIPNDYITYISICLSWNTIK